MKHFILKTSVFLGVLLLLVGVLLLLPPTPRAAKSLLFAEVKKDSLLANTPPPRLIFVGGSNLSFGLNSQAIKDSLHVNPVNTAIHAGYGLQYMLKNTMQHLRGGDILLLVPEYGHFYKDWDAGSEELFRAVFDCNLRKISLLSPGQIYSCALHAGNFLLSKLSPFEYAAAKEDDVYSVGSFNRYGDVDAHWSLENRHHEITDNAIDPAKYNPKVITEIKRIAHALHEMGCTLLISYPCLQSTSFNRSKSAIKKVEEEYLRSGLTVLGTPERYMMPDSLMFNSAYHLNMQGVKRRTSLLTEDLAAALPAAPH